MTTIKDMLGLTVTEINGKQGDEEITFHTKEGRSFTFYHDQSCCESVYLEDVVGDLDDLIGRPLVKAEEVSSEGTPGKEHPESWDEYEFEWTFYKLGTARGVVTLRFYGTSNGYYSTSVDIREARRRH